MPPRLPFFGIHQILPNSGGKVPHEGGGRLLPYGEDLFQRVMDVNWGGQVLEECSYGLVQGDTLGFDQTDGSAGAAWPAENGMAIVGNVIVVTGAWSSVMRISTFTFGVIDVQQFGDVIVYNPIMPVTDGTYVYFGGPTSGVSSFDWFIGRMNPFTGGTDWHNIGDALGFLGGSEWFSCYCSGFIYFSSYHFLLGKVDVETFTLETISLNDISVGRCIGLGTDGTNVYVSTDDAFGSSQVFKMPGGTFDFGGASLSLGSSGGRMEIVEDSVYLADLWNGQGVFKFPTDLSGVTYNIPTPGIGYCQGCYYDGNRYVYVTNYDGGSTSTSFLDRIDILNGDFIESMAITPMLAGYNPYAHTMGMVFDGVPAPGNTHFAYVLAFGDAGPTNEPPNDFEMFRIDMTCGTHAVPVITYYDLSGMYEMGEFEGPVLFNDQPTGTLFFEGAMYLTTYDAVVTKIDIDTMTITNIEWSGINDTSGGLLTDGTYIYTIGPFIGYSGGGPLGEGNDWTLVKYDPANLAQVSLIHVGTDPGWIEHASLAPACIIGDYLYFIVRYGEDILSSTGPMAGYPPGSGPYYALSFINRVKLSDGSLTQLNIPDYPGAAIDNPYDLCGDGSRYVYVCTRGGGSHILKLDTLDFSFSGISHVQISVGTVVGGMCVTPDRVYMADSFGENGVISVATDLTDIAVHYINVGEPVAWNACFWDGGRYIYVGRTDYTTTVGGLASFGWMGLLDIENSHADMAYGLQWPVSSNYFDHQQFIRFDGSAGSGGRFYVFSGDKPLIARGNMI